MTAFYFFIIIRYSLNNVKVNKSIIEFLTSISQLQVKYFDLYAERFGFENYVKFRHEIIKLEPNSDYEETGKWKITAKDLNIGQTVTDVFDGVMICTGHHVTPSVPKFKDQDKFKGTILHTHSFKKPNAFEDKTVVVVGIGNSGGDAVVELSTVAKEVKPSISYATTVSSIQFV